MAARPRQHVVVGIGLRLIPTLTRRKLARSVEEATDAESPNEPDDQNRRRALDDERLRETEMRFSPLLHACRAARRS